MWCTELDIADQRPKKRDDRYTLDDLWPGVAKSLKRSEAAACINEINGLRRLRNLAGAHYNEWAQTVTSVEAQRFAAGVLELLARTWCSKCTAWVRRTAHTLVCPCGSVRLVPSPSGRERLSQLAGATQIRRGLARPR